MREERGRALVVELAEHVVEEQHRRCADDVGAETMAGQPQRERERALLALRRVRAAVELVDAQAPLVAMRAGQGDPAVELGLAPFLERGEERRLQSSSSSTGDRQPGRLVGGVGDGVGAGELLVGVAHERREAFEHPQPPTGELGAGAGELGVEHLQRALVVGVAHAVA